MPAGNTPVCFSLGGNSFDFLAAEVAPRCLEKDLLLAYEIHSPSRICSFRLDKLLILAV